jgi:hypothetical protein
VNEAVHEDYAVDANRNETAERRSMREFNAGSFLGKLIVWAKSHAWAWFSEAV